MVIPSELPGSNTSDLDASSSLEGLGPVESTDPTQDIDGDGTLDTVITTGDGATSVGTETDLDGLADRAGIVEGDGDYSAWEYHRNPDGAGEWRKTDHGTVGGISGYPRDSAVLDRSGTDTRPNASNRVMDTARLGGESPGRCGVEQRGSSHEYGAAGRHAGGRAGEAGERLSR